MTKHWSRVTHLPYFKRLNWLASIAAAVHELVGAPDFLTNPPCNIGKTFKNVIFVNYIIEDPSWFGMPSLIQYSAAYFYQLLFIWRLVFTILFLEITISRDANLSSTCKFIFIILQIIRLRSISLSWELFQVWTFFENTSTYKKTDNHQAGSSFSRNSSWGYRVL